MWLRAGAEWSEAACGASSGPGLPSILTLACTSACTGAQEAQCSSTSASPHPCDRAERVEQRAAACGAVEEDACRADLFDTAFRLAVAASALRHSRRSQACVCSTLASALTCSRSSCGERAMQQCSR